jgi:DNA repair exonuclease SbcCD ATPase subunit
MLAAILALALGHEDDPARAIDDRLTEFHFRHQRRHRGVLSDREQALIEKESDIEHRLRLLAQRQREQPGEREALAPALEQLRADAQALREERRKLRRGAPATAGLPRADGAAGGPASADAQKQELRRVAQQSGRKRLARARERHWAQWAAIWGILIAGVCGVAFVFKRRAFEREMGARLPSVFESLHKGRSTQ